MASKSDIERVQAVLIGPLVEMGMRRMAGVAVEDHAAFLGRLAERLAYMADAPLLVLREIVARHGGGKARDVWPSEVSVLSWAHALVPPPESRLVTSWMASVEGRRTWDEDPLLALALQRHLRISGAPPQTRHADHWPAIRAKAAAWARQRQRLLERQERAALGAEDADWLAGLDRALVQLEALVRSRVEAGEGSDEGGAADGGAVAG